jgi:peptidoglycan/xylan/chitin deacetylase (PgdA/CDA1 family)
VLREILGQLRKRRYNLMPLEEVFRRLREGQPMERAVAFTIDDGYFDHARVGAPIFADFDCPVTIFVATGFLDGKVWFWWDQISYIFERTTQPRISLRLADKQVTFEVSSQRSRSQATADLISRCTDSLHADRMACIAELNQIADVELPAIAPPAFEPLSWDEARSLEKRGVTFGAHTVTHPILSTTSAEQSNREILESLKRVQEELARPSPVFCYPNGRRCDFGDREMASVTEGGFWGAVSGYPAALRPTEYRTPPAICRVPRYPLQDDLLLVMQCVSGLETLKARLRGTAAPC